MIRIRSYVGLFAFAFVCVFSFGCGTSGGKYFGATKAPSDNVMRYISGSEPESLDPAVPTGQPEARVLMALYDGLVEYHPLTQEPIPAIAESWSATPDGTEYTFHLRKNAKFSNGDPITAKDFVFTCQRSLSPELASRNASLGFYIKYSEGFNSGNAFVKNADGSFMLASGDSETVTTGAPAAFSNAMRMIVPGEEADRAKLFEKKPELKTKLEGKEIVPIKAEDIGVWAPDDYTVKIKLYQPAPYFTGLLAHQMFRVVHRATIEKFDKDWTRPENIVTSGAFKLKRRVPYDIVETVRDPNNWDAANVRLDGVTFLPIEDQGTQVNLYKSGDAYALLNHAVNAAWIEEIQKYKSDYLNFPENAAAYYSMNVKRPPFDNLKVRQAFSLAVDRVALSKFRKVTKPLYQISPQGILPPYDEAQKKVSEEIRKERGISEEEWAKRDQFDAERARKLLGEAGFPVQKNGEEYSCPSFAIGNIAITFNTQESNKQIAEFVQQQWKRHLGITVPLKNMEFKTFLPLRNSLQFDGFALSLWSGDYMDPFTFLNLHYGEQNDGGSGFHDPKYDEMLDKANQELDAQKRFEILARAEFYLTEQYPVVPLTVNSTNFVKKPYVKGMYPNAGSLYPWKFVYIERDESKWDADVENIMKTPDPQIAAQLEVLTKSQRDFEAASTSGGTQ